MSEGVVQLTIDDKSYIYLYDFIDMKPDLPSPYQSNAHLKHDLPKDVESGSPLLLMQNEKLTLEDLVVPHETKKMLDVIMEENRIFKEQKKRDLQPKNMILLYGPTGTGKTLTASIISAVMGYPLARVILDSTISSNFGHTISNLRRIFDFVSDKKVVLVFDEFDVIGNRSNDPHKRDEVNSLVNIFMQMLDDFNGPCILVAATNQQRLLDPAIQRRFDEIISFDLPDVEQRSFLLDIYLRPMKIRCNVDRLANSIDGFSAADIAQACKNAKKHQALNGHDIIWHDTIDRALDDQRKRKCAISNHD